MIANIEDRTTQADRDARGRRFMIESCHGLAELLPSRAAHWLEVARAYAAGEASLDTLTATRVEAWTHLAKRSCDFDDPRVNAVRAVIFVLPPPTTGSRSGTIACTTSSSSARTPEPMVMRCAAACARRSPTCWRSRAMHQRESPSPDGSGEGLRHLGGSAGIT